ncbi:hypothetical protein F0919_04260 [Taibaiella lutea]|uniref:Uncharacterized protein n=1 Tax=Taibaiella lutea TaxID=2608001 RepID=A0A5M6CPL6_9BACT|nr:hypothetical protein [Taibaiella lutea]KAA5536893.1 hypothetical protein F0919_04260 [Taibaiella lutea]
MCHLETLKEALLQVMRKYPVDAYTGEIPSKVVLQRYLAEATFLQNETATIHKMSIAVLQNDSVTLDDVQRVINEAIHQHFRVRDSTVISYNRVQSIPSPRPE